MINLSNIFKSSKQKSFITNPSTLNPHKHWVLLVRGLLIVVCILIIFSLYLLYEIKNEKIFQATPTETTKPITLKDDLLKKVTDSFYKKSQKSESINNTSPSYQDPSI